jgi:hypothetical protein
VCGSTNEDTWTNIRLALTKIDEAISARVGTLARMLRLTFLLASFIAFALPRDIRSSGRSNRHQ